MMKPFSTVNSGHTVTVNLFVKADGKTVCDPTDKEVAEMKYAAGTQITEAEKNALIFPGATPEPTPDAEQRGAEVVPDAEKRGGKRK